MATEGLGAARPASGFIDPLPSQRVFVSGKTGSGKTVFANWLLSRAPFDKMPYTIIDYKRDGFFASLKDIPEITHKSVPKRPGIYIMRPMRHQFEQLDEWFWRVWEKGRQGIYIDEGYMLPDYRSFEGYRTLITQGRSLHIPLITLTQRPVFLDKFIISEADFYSVFHINSKKDRMEVQQYVPFSVEQRLAKYHSYWYDVGRDTGMMLTPTPPTDEIAAHINMRLDRIGKRSRAVLL